MLKYTYAGIHKTRAQIVCAHFGSQLGDDVIAPLKWGLIIDVYVLSDPALMIFTICQYLRHCITYSLTYRRVLRLFKM